MSRADLTSALRAHLNRAVTLRAEIARDPARRLRRAALRQWQSARLTATYADVAANPLYRPATDFFLADLYTTRDLTERDRELGRALPAMVKLMPSAALEPLEVALELDAGTEALDADLAARLPIDRDGKPKLDTETYAAAYRTPADLKPRERQIELLVAVGTALDKVAHGRLLATTIAMMRGPAHAAGFGELQAFLERGLAAFRHMRSAREFLDIVQYRERRILARLYENATDPFQVA